VFFCEPVAEMFLDLLARLLGEVLPRNLVVGVCGEPWQGSQSVAARCGQGQLAGVKVGQGSNARAGSHFCKALRPRPNPSGRGKLFLAAKPAAAVANRELALHRLFRGK
jgi:hypothetical protein